jgi:type II secretory pathway predicted ATPase ExeA
MLKEFMAYFELRGVFKEAGFFEIENHERLVEELKAAILAGKLVAFCGIIGCGKTTTLRRVQKDLQKDKKILISKSLAVTIGRVKLPTLIQALYFDLSPSKKVTIPGQPEKRERKLVELVHKRNRPVALFIDDAHELHGISLGRNP